MLPRTTSPPPSTSRPTPGKERCWGSPVPPPSCPPPGPARSTRPTASPCSFSPSSSPSPQDDGGDRPRGGTEGRPRGVSGDLEDRPLAPSGPQCGRIGRAAADRLDRG